LQLLLLPALREILDPSGGAFGIVLVIFDVQAFGGEEALLDRDPPRPVVGVAVALQADGLGHRRFLHGAGCFPALPAS